MREMIVTGISVDPDSKSPVMILRDKSGDRILPIWIGPVEAGSISVAINRVPMPRPLTHDLMLTMLRSLNVALTAARFILWQWYYGENADTGKLQRVIDCLLKALSAERQLS